MWDRCLRSIARGWAGRGRRRPSRLDRGRVLASERVRWRTTCWLPPDLNVSSHEHACTALAEGGLRFAQLWRGAEVMVQASEVLAAGCVAHRGKSWGTRVTQRQRLAKNADDPSTRPSRRSRRLAAGAVGATEASVHRRRPRRRLWSAPPSRFARTTTPSRSDWPPSSLPSRRKRRASRGGGPCARGSRYWGGWRLVPACEHGGPPRAVQRRRPTGCSSGPTTAYGDAQGAVMRGDTSAASLLRILDVGAIIVDHYPPDEEPDEVCHIDRYQPAVGAGDPE
jgi:hypothetical protein